MKIHVYYNITLLSDPYISRNITISKTDCRKLKTFERKVVWKYVELYDRRKADRVKVTANYKTNYIEKKNKVKYASI